MAQKFGNSKIITNFAVLFNIKGRLRPQTYQLAVFLYPDYKKYRTPVEICNRNPANDGG